MDGSPRDRLSLLFGGARTPDSSRKTAIRVLAWRSYLSRLLQRTAIFLKGAKRRAAIALACLMLTWSLASGAAFAGGTGGRAGGNFGRSSSPSPGRIYSSPPSRNYNHNYYYRPRSTPSPLYFRPPGPSITVISPGMQPYGPAVYRKPISASDVAFVAGAGLLVAYGVSNQLQKERDQSSSALGPGFSVSRLTVSLNVPNRDDPNSFLQRIDHLCTTARTDTRKGVQQLILDVALELLRQEKAIRSAEARSIHYKQEGDAGRDFMRLSIQQRSKFDKEVEYKGGRPAATLKNRQNDDSSATEAVVTILVAMEGDSTQLPRIQRLENVREALQRIAADSQVDNCLMSGEVLWAPALRSETLSLDDIYVDYPSLFPL